MKSHKLGLKKCLEYLLSENLSQSLSDLGFREIVFMGYPRSVKKGFVGGKSIFIEESKLEEGGVIRASLDGEVIDDINLIQRALVGAEDVEYDPATKEGFFKDHPVVLRKMNDRTLFIITRDSGVLA